MAKILRDRIARLERENKMMRRALWPFAEIGVRLGWDKIDEEDDMQLNQHVVEAPAPELGDGAVYCLFVSAFRRAALIINGGGHDRAARADREAQGAEPQDP